MELGLEPPISGQYTPVTKLYSGVQVGYRIKTLKTTQTLGILRVYWVCKLLTEVEPPTIGHFENILVAMACGTLKAMNAFLNILIDLFTTLMPYRISITSSIMVCIWARIRFLFKVFFSIVFFLCFLSRSIFRWIKELDMENRSLP